MAGDLFFFDQWSKRKPPQRFRKVPEDLPQSLRYAQLNPKVAAYLAKQGAPLGGGSALGMAGGEKGEEVKSSAAAGIQEMGGMLKAQLESALMVEDQDSSRGLLEETKMNAPVLLYQLARVLYRPEGSSRHDIPGSLEWSLSQKWNMLTAESKTVHRDWQSAAHREAALHRSSLEASDSVERPLSSSNSDLAPRRPPHGPKRTRNSSQALAQLGDINENAEMLIAKHSRAREREKDSKGDGMASLQVPRTSTAASGPRNTSRRHQPKSRGVESRGVSRGPHLESRMSAIERASSRKGGSGQDSVYGDSARFFSPSRHHAVVAQGYIPTLISFQLSNESCDEKGWIVHPEDTQEDRDRQHASALEKIFRQLQDARKLCERTRQDEIDRGLGKPITIRYYGDKTQEELSRYRKARTLSVLTKGGKPRIPTTYLDESYARKKLCYTSYADGTTAVFYPSGRLAVLASPGKPAGNYTYVYDDSSDKRPMAFFTPSGRGSCYHSNNRSKLLTTEKGVAMADEEGTLQLKYRWPSHGSRLPHTINITLNSYLTYKCVSQQGCQLTFTCFRETFKFALGPTPGSAVPKKDELGTLQTQFQFMSLAALDHLHPAVRKEKKKLRGRKSELAELRKSLQYEDGSQYDTEADRELAKLQAKAKEVVEGWFDHYRIHLGLMEPELDELMDSQIPSTATTRQISSAKEREEAPSLMRRKGRPKTAPPTRPRTMEQTTELAGSKDKQTPGLHVPKSTKTVSMALPHTVMQIEEGDGEEDGGGALGEGEWKIPSRFIHPQSAGPAIRRANSNVRLTSPYSRPNTVPSGGSGRTDKLAYIRGCPAAARKMLLGAETAFCRCSRHKIPLLTDLEFSSFFSSHVTPGQMVVITITSSLFPKNVRNDNTLEEIHVDQNRNRSRPCLAQVRDAYRLFRYDVATAAAQSDHTTPFLVRRHNVVPGMVLMYRGEHLLFCDHIFNGYGSARRDFFKQLHQSDHDASRGFHLPKDFRFSPSKGRQGLRSAWGGQIGGTGVDHFGGKGISLESQTLLADTSASSMDSDSVSTLKIALAGAANPPDRLREKAATFVSASLGGDFHLPTADIGTPRRLGRSETTLSSVSHAKLGSVRS